MKIRAGFVSNSSSSSFIAVGIDDTNVARQLGWQSPEDEDYDYEQTKLQDYGYGTWRVPGSKIVIYGGYDLQCVGLEAEALLNGNYRVSEIGVLVLAELEKLGISTRRKPKLVFGETSNEY